MPKKKLTQHDKDFLKEMRGKFDSSSQSVRNDIIRNFPKGSIKDLGMFGFSKSEIRKAKNPNSLWKKWD